MIAEFGWDSDTYMKANQYYFTKAEVEMIAGTGLTLVMFNSGTKLVTITTTGKQVIFLKCQAPSDLSAYNDWLSFSLAGAEGNSFKIYKISNYKISAEEYALTAEELNQRYGFHPNGTKSTVCAMRLKSVGKNLFDGTFSENTFYNSERWFVFNSHKHQNVYGNKV